VPNNLNAYSLNGVTVETSAEGSVAVQFGGCDGKVPNCLPIVAGGNYMARFYRLQSESPEGNVRQARSSFETLESPVGIA
jgi:hypothetical protein